MEVFGIRSGFRGLLDNDIEPLTEKSLSGLLNLGGTILGTSREKPFKKRLSAASEDKPALMLKNIHELGLDCIVCIGGNGTQKTAAKLAQAGVNVVSVPKTIDNDVWGTDVFFRVRFCCNDCNRCHRPFAFDCQFAPACHGY